MSTFRALISSHTGMSEELPLIHTSRCEFIDVIISGGGLTPQPCPVFHEDLLYLFYGRPAYRSRKGHQGGDRIGLCPVCFVFKPGSAVTTAIRRLFPCDSGALAADRFQPEIHTSDRDDLELEPNIESARKLVSLYFAKNSRYFHGEVAPGITLPGGSIEERFLQLLQRDGPVQYDDRKSAIEIQTDQNISLTDQLLFIVLPESYMDEAQIREAILMVWKCDVITYEFVKGSAPNEYYAIVRSCVRKRFREATRI